MKLNMDCCRVGAVPNLKAPCCPSECLLFGTGLQEDTTVDALDPALRTHNEQYAIVPIV